MPNVFAKSTIEGLIGGNAGIVGFEFLSDFTAAHLGQTGAARAAIKTVIKGLGGASIAMLSPQVGNKNDDAGSVVLGFGIGPMMTIASDWYEVFKNKTPAEDGAGSAISWKTKRLVRRGAGPDWRGARPVRSAGPIMTPVRQTGVARRPLALEV